MLSNTLRQISISLEPSRVVLVRTDPHHSPVAIQLVRGLQVVPAVRPARSLEIQTLSISAIDLFVQDYQSIIMVSFSLFFLLYDFTI